MKLVHELWNGYVMCPDYDRAKRTNDKVKQYYIASPTGSQFTAKLAEEFVSIYGPRKLYALDAMCKKRGPWSETARVSKKTNKEYKTVICSKYEHELEIIERREKAYKTLTPEDINRREELMNLLPEELSGESDDVLQARIDKWVHKLNQHVFVMPQ
jgi:hypothetical protein